MKKLNYLLLGAAGLLMASCSQEDLAGPANGDGNVRVRIHLPGDALGTRAGTDYGNGTSNKVLNYAAYDATTGELLFNGVEPFGTSTETVLTLNLLNKSYKLAFFAQSVTSQNTAEAEAESNAVYEFNAADKTIMVNYGNMTSEGNFNDAYDCFYNVVTVEGATASSIDVDLYRPMAQINWGTDDIASTKEIETIFGTDGEYIMSNLTVNSQDGLPTTLNFMTGALSGNYTAPLGEFKIPQGAYPIEGYDYVAVQYVLAGAPAAIVSADNGMTASSQTLYDLTLTISNAGNTELEGEPYEADAVAVQSVPVQANYQTNIYGTLLSYNFSANIEVIPGFADTNNVPVTPWDGKTLTYPTIPTNPATPVTITQPSDLAGLADMITNGTNLPAGVPQDFKGYTIQLEGSVDMGGNSLSIGAATRSSGNANGQAFRGTFDGGNNTISNLSYSAPANQDKNTAVGVFPNVDGAGVVKNIKFENLQIDGGNADQSGVVGLLTNGATVSNVIVGEGSKISSNEGAGGIVGRLMKNGTVENCDNYATITVGQQNGGGIVGAAYYTSTEGNGMTITGCNNYGDVTSTKDSSVAVGGIAGLSCATIENCENWGAVTGAQNSVGGIVGAQQSAGYIRGCTNHGVVTAPKATMAVGGIVGWVKYLNSDTNYPKENIIEVTGCKNYADVYGNNGAGGIVGSWYRAGVCSGNENYADKISATSGFVAGIIGSSQFLDNNNGPAPDKVDGYEDMLYVRNNKTTTTWANMTGSLKSWIVYANSPEYVTLENNTPNQTENGQNGFE